MSRVRTSTTCPAKSVITAVLLLVVAVGAHAQTAPWAKLAGPLKALAAGASGAAPAAATAAAPGSAQQAFALARTLAPNGQVRVVVYFQSPGVVSVGAIGAAGGRVEIARDRRVQALVPVAALQAVAAIPGVTLVDIPAQVFPTFGFGANVSQGVQLTNALQFQANGITGTGCKVAVVDLGFLGFATAEINKPTTTSFRADGLVSVGSAHGCAVAEVVQDMAPDAQLTLVAVDTPLSIENAIDYIIANKFQVAVMSLGIVDGPFDGTSPLSAAVNRARAGGVFWVTAAGNFAQRHWEGDFVDTNNDGLNEFTSGTPKMSVTLPVGQFDAYLSWFQSAGGVTAQDYDLVLLDSAGNQVAQSAYSQTGSTPPQEHLVALISTAGVYSLEIKAIAIDKTKKDRFQLFLPNVDIGGNLAVAAHSLSIPAEAQHSYTVGATRGSTLAVAGLPVIPIDNIEPFSSRGPALGNFTAHKPDLVAPDVVTTSLAANATGGGDVLSPFVGTSAAAPHVAGAAALLWSEDNTRTADALEAALKLRAVMPDAAKTEKDIPDTYGSGRLSIFIGADVTPPTITITHPHTGDTISEQRPVITATITDTRSKIDTNSILLTLDGVAVIKNGKVYDTDGTTIIPEVLPFDASTGILTYAVQTKLKPKSHQITLDAKDTAGNIGTQAVVNFRVSLPSIGAGLRLFSLPYTNLTTTDPAAIFGLPIDQIKLIRWYPPDPSVSKYHVYPEPEATFDPPDAHFATPTVSSPPAGLGYFLSLAAPASFLQDAVGQTVTDPSYTINLIRGTGAFSGWTMVGNPFTSPVDWGGVEFVTNGVRQDIRTAIASGVTDGVLFDFISTAGGGFYDFSADPLAATMQPLKAYWLHVSKDTALVIYSAGSITASERSKPAAKVAAPTTDNWQMRIVASAGAAQDPANVVGVSTAASGGFTPGQDVIKPPPLSDTVRSYVACRDLGAHAGLYARRVLPAGAANNAWNFEVSSSLSQGAASLQWPDINSTVPAQVRLTLRDLDTGRDIYMRTASGYTFQTPEGGGVRHFSIIATTDAAATLTFAGMSAQSVHGGGVALSYTLSAPASVTVEIRNISGVPVKRFAETNAGATVQTLVWNGLSDRGTKTPSGRYLARITARTDDGQTVQAIRPFEVTH